MPCRKCNGSGKISGKFYKEFMDMMKDEVNSYAAQTFQRMIVDHLGMRAAD